MVPLAVRQRMAVAIGRGFPGSYGWTMDLLRDWAEQDPSAFHRFLWSHHLAYAETYEVERRFGPENLHPNRLMLFDDLEKHLEGGLRKRAAEITSIFEVGCSLGYLLRYLETHRFPGATIMEGNDIDRYAVDRGQRYLDSVASRIRLHAADMAQLSEVLGDRHFDLILAAGVLMYLPEEDAAATVTTVLEHTGVLAAFAGLAHPDRDNRLLGTSERRARDGTFIHNLDRMIERAGGRIIARRWEGARQVGGNTVYFVFAEPR